MGYLGTPIDTNNTFQSLVGKRFNGDGSTTAFTLDVAPTSVLDIEVFVENVRQDPNSAYSLSGVTLTFAAAPDAGTNNIYVIHQAKAVATISAGEGTVQASSFSNDVISGHTALAAIPATTDELLISDAGTIKRIDAQFFQNTPSFYATLTSDQVVANNTLTRINFDVEQWDSDGKYDNSSNYRFTPGIVGKYVFFMAACFESNIDDGHSVALRLRKNGSDFVISGQQKIYSSAASQTMRVEGTGIIELDADDYIEMFVQHTSGENTNVRNTESGFGAYKLIGI